jgi:branched-chain amino acid transport system permease protein
MAAFAILPFILPDYLTVFFGRVLILGLLAISFDLVYGFSGILSFGQALFFGGAGYGVALLARDHGISSILVVVPVSFLIGLALSWLVAAFLLLGRHPPSVIFVALGTLTGSFAADQLARAWYYLGGQNGIPSIPLISLGHHQFGDVPFYYVIFGLFLGIYLLCRALARSQFGLALAGIREQEERVGFFGYRVETFKTIAFTLAGAIAGLAGGLYAFHEGFVWPSMLGVGLSTQIVLYCLFGGVGTLIGPVLGVVVVEGVTYGLSDSFPELWPVLLGLLLLLVILFRPTGVVSIIVSERERIGDFAPRAWRRMAAEDERGGWAR